MNIVSAFITFARQKAEQYPLMKEGIMEIVERTTEHVKLHEEEVDMHCQVGATEINDLITKNSLEKMEEE